MLEQPAAFFQTFLFFALNFLQASGAVGLGLFLALTGLSGQGLFGHLLLAQAGLFFGFDLGRLFGQQFGLAGLLLFLACDLGPRCFAHRCAPRLLIELTADRGLCRDGHRLALVGGGEETFAAGFQSTGQGARKTLGILFAPGFFLRQEVIAAAHGPLDFAVLRADFLVRHVKPFVTDAVELQGRAHTRRLGGLHGQEGVAPSTAKRRIVLHHHKLGAALGGAGVDRHIVDALELAAPSHRHRLHVLRRDVNARLKVGRLHLALDHGLALNGDFEVAHLLGVLHTRGHHHRIGLACQQLVLPGVRRPSQSQPAASDDHPVARLQGACRN